MSLGSWFALPGSAVRHLVNFNTWRHGRQPDGTFQWGAHCPTVGPETVALSLREEAIDQYRPCRRCAASQRWRAAQAGALADEIRADIEGWTR